MTTGLTAERIEQTIRVIRGHRVMLDMDLAELYCVDVKQLKRQVRRNKDRFPIDFLIELSIEEQRSLRYQFGTLNRGAHSKYRSYAFTEQGVAMLSSVLRSKRAIHTNIAIMRAFVKLRQLAAGHKALANKLEQLERKVGGHDGQIQSLFEAIRRLMAPPTSKPRRIGFST